MLAGPGVAGRAAALLVASGLILAACTAQHGSTVGAGRHHTAGPLPAAKALLASPGRLVDQPVASTGCGRLLMVRPGTTARLSLAVPPASAAGARTRSGWLHVPARYAPRRPAPLVLAFHGDGGTGPGMEHTSGLSALADQRGFLVAYPQAMAQPRGGQVGWDSSGPHDPFADHIDDGLFTSDILNVLQAGYCVDPARIAVAGFSNGGGMTGYLACVLAGRISAFAAVEGEFFQIPGGCRPSRPASILDVHAVTDPVAPYAGVPARGAVPAARSGRPTRPAISTRSPDGPSGSRRPERTRSPGSCCRQLRQRGDGPQHRPGGTEVRSSSGPDLWTNTFSGVSEGTRPPDTQDHNTVPHRPNMPGNGVYPVQRPTEGHDDRV